MKKKASGKTPSQRLLEAAKQAQAGQSGQTFSRAMGKATLARNSRKPTRMG